MNPVLLVNMPFYHLRWPNLGLGLLKAALQERGIGCDVAYLNFDFAERTGLEHYHWIADQFAFVLGGEWLFAQHYFGAAPPGRLPQDAAYWDDVLAPADPDLTSADREAFRATYGHVEPFLDACMRTINIDQYRVVGFSASFQQTLASLCLARRIKRARPETAVVFGGAACEAEMGAELLRQFPEVDYVFLGEADLTLPAVVESLLAGATGALPAGVVGREASPDACQGVRDGAPCCPQGGAALPNRSPGTIPSRALPVKDLDALPCPDFDDYFARLRRSPLQDQIDTLIFFETSRGCWWGQEHHCAFCGLNGSALAYRSKSARRAVDELRTLAERYGVRRACAADNILDPRYFKTFLPLLREAALDLEFAYEMRTHLSRQQVEALYAAGLRAAQLGIETFSTPLLKLIHKGTTAIENLQALKWFTEVGVTVKWNLLYGFPQEDPAEYGPLAELLPSLVHLAPPLAVGQVRMDRFSPYFDDPAGRGTAHPRPHRAFRHVYPFAPEVLARLAYYYEFDYADGRNPLHYAAPVVAAAERWQELKDLVSLSYWDRPDGVLIITDTRPAAVQFQWRLAGTERAAYLFCDTGRTPAAVGRWLAQTGTSPMPEAPAVQQMLDRWTAGRIMARLDGRYLSLALGVDRHGSEPPS